MEVHVPFAPRDPKTRLAPVLDEDERALLAIAMCCDVCDAVAGAGHDPVVLSTRPLDAVADRYEDGGRTDDVAAALADRDHVVDDRPLDAAVGALLEEAPTAVAMSDLALATPDAVERLLAPDADVTIAPGLRAGTNAFVARDDGFTVDYHGASYLDHRSIAEDAGLGVAVVDSFRLAVDVDEPEDLVEVHVHGEGRAAALVRDRFALVADDEGRVGIERRGERA